MSNFPYPGLRPFRRDETDIFFGRREVTDQLIARLGETHFLAVVGLSGCGKSSLVRTGLLAGLETGFLASAGARWRIAELRPGNRPFARLAKALLAETALKKEYTAHLIEPAEAPNLMEAGLRRGPLGMHEILTDTSLPPDTNLLILVDQFEELFRHYQRGEADESAAFVRLLLESGKHSAIYVVITMRSDFLGDCALFYGLPEKINQGLFLTPRLDREQLRTVIEGPAKVFDGGVEPVLTNRLLNEMGDHPDQLPVLQHALMRMWRFAEAENTQQTVLNLTHYEKTGGLANALLQHAEETYTKLSSAKQGVIESLFVLPKSKIAEILFRRLCERDPASRDTRSPAKLGDVATLAGVPWQQIATVVDAFRQDGCHFLMPPPGIDLELDSIIDISHESLIRRWQRLEKWAEEEAKSADVYRRLEDSARRRKKEGAELLSGMDLKIALKWREREQPDAIWARRYAKEEDKSFSLAMAFLMESEQAQKQKQEEKEKEEAQQREQQEKEAARQQKLKQAHKLAVSATIGLLVAVLLAMWGYWERNQAISARQETKQTEKERTISLFDSQLTHATLLAKNEEYARAKEIVKKTRVLDPEIRPERRHVRNWLDWFNELMGGAPEQTYQEVGAPLFAVAVDSKGEQVAAAGENGTLVLFDAKTGQLSQRLQGNAGEVSVKAVIFHPKGEWLASAGYDKQIILWSLPEGEQIRKLNPPGAVLALAVSPDGKYLASGGKDKDITLWDAQSGELLNTLKGHKKQISGLAFSPDGESLASTSYDNTVRLWQVNNGRELHVLTGHTKNVQKADFSPDGKLLATSSSDKTVRLWEVAPGKELYVLHGHQNAVFGVRFIANGRYLVSASRDGTLREWDTQYGITVRVLQGHATGVTGIAAFGEQIFSAGNDGTVRRWNTALPYQQEVDLPGEPVSVAIAPDGDKVAVGFADGFLRLYALPDPALLWEQEKAHKKSIQNLAFSSGGALLASAGFDKTAKVWRIEENKLVRQQTFSPRDAVNDIAFSPYGRTLAAAGFDGRIALFSLGTEQKHFYLAHKGKVNSISFDSKGTRLLSAGEHEVRLWDINNEPPVLLQEYVPSQDRLKQSAFSPDDRRIASVGRDQLLHIYATAGKPAQESLAGHESTIYRVIFSPDGQQAATVSADATLRLWDLSNKSELFSLRLPANSGRPVPFRDFDVRCLPQGNCRIAVPLIRGKLMLYNLRNIYEKKPESLPKTVTKE